MAGFNIRQVKDPTTATSKWVTNAGNAASDWANGLANPKADPIQSAINAASDWQSAVSSLDALVNYKNGLGKVNPDTYLAVVNGRGKTNYTGGVKDKQANYASFSAQWQPFMQQTLSNLNRSNPRGPRGQNRSRLNAYLDALESAKGKFRSK